MRHVLLLGGNGLHLLLRTLHVLVALHEQPEHDHVGYQQKDNKKKQSGVRSGLFLGYVAWGCAPVVGILHCRVKGSGRVLI